MRFLGRRAIRTLTVLVLGVVAGIAGTATLSAQRGNGPASPMQMMPGMSAEPTPGASSARPFYREPTFLLLVGMVAAAGGVVAYRARASGRRAVSAANEAVLVVDLVESTHLAIHYGDTLAMRARNTLKDLALAPPIEARATMTYGEILLDARGNRHGATISKAFRVMGLSQTNFARVEGAAESPAVPDRNRILIDEEAAQELRAAEEPRRFVGFCRLKGFSGLHGVYEVLWGAATMTQQRPAGG